MKQKETINTTNRHSEGATATEESVERNRSFATAQDDSKRKCAFTLAETLIALVVLGIIAALTVPALVKKQVEKSNRTKLKKVMAVYEKALNNMVVMNNLKSNDDIKNEFNAAENSNSCSKSRNYFKSVKEGYNDCTFKTSDGVWWNISNIENPIISLKDEITSANIDTIKENAESQTKDKTSYSMIGYLDENGVLRVNDLGVAKDGETVPTAKNKTYISKLYNFMNNDESLGGGGTKEKCNLKAGSETDYECDGSELTWKKQTLTAEEAAAASVTKNKFCIWNGTTCDSLPNDTSTANAGDMFVSEVTLTQADLNESCTGSRWNNCNKNDYWNAYRKKCAENGAHLATAAELKAMYNMTNSPLSSGSYYWAAEANSKYTNYAYGFNTLIDSVGDAAVNSNGGVSNFSGKAVCVGN